MQARCGYLWHIYDALLCTSHADEAKEGRLLLDTPPSPSLLRVPCPPLTPYNKPTSPTARSARCRPKKRRPQRMGGPGGGLLAHAGWRRPPGGAHAADHRAQPSQGLAAGRAVGLRPLHRPAHPGPAHGAAQGPLPAGKHVWLGGSIGAARGRGACTARDGGRSAPALGATLAFLPHTPCGTACAAPNGARPSSPFPITTPHPPPPRRCSLCPRCPSGAAPPWAPRCLPSVPWACTRPFSSSMMTSRTASATPQPRHSPVSDGRRAAVSARHRCLAAAPQHVVRLACCCAAPRPGRSSARVAVGQPSRAAACWRGVQGAAIPQCLVEDGCCGPLCVSRGQACPAWLPK